MAYDEALAQRLRSLLDDEHGMTEKKMFGGLAFLIDGKMSVCASSQGSLMVRVDPAETKRLLEDECAERFHMRGKAMNGWLLISPEGSSTEEQLAEWVAIGVRYARSLPAKH